MRILILLWFAFKLYLWRIEHNLMMWSEHGLCVVICFQIVSLTYWTQLLQQMLQQIIRCDLLSNCIFDVLNTTLLKEFMNCIMLWFAFKLYLWRIEHNRIGFNTFNCSVVICFQIVSLTYWTQQLSIFLESLECCDLLSNCIFDVLNTTAMILPRNKNVLWFAFKLYLWRIEHNVFWWY